MFTIEQIKAEHSKVKSGADFPKYIQDIIGIGVIGYATFVTDGQAVYYGRDGYQIQSDPKYATLLIADKSNHDQFKKGLKEHQQGKIDYLTFCSMCANEGIEKWVVEMDKMTCSYYDKAGNEMLVEIIPTVS